MQFSLLSLEWIKMDCVISILITIIAVFSPMTKTRVLPRMQFEETYNGCWKHCNCIHAFIFHLLDNARRCKTRILKLVDSLSLYVKHRHSHKRGHCVLYTSTNVYCVSTCVIFFPFTCLLASNVYDFAAASHVFCDVLHRASWSQVWKTGWLKSKVLHSLTHC